MRVIHRGPHDTKRILKFNTILIRILNKLKGKTRILTKTGHSHRPVVVARWETVFFNLIRVQRLHIILPVQTSVKIRVCERNRAACFQNMLAFLV